MGWKHQLDDYGRKGVFFFFSIFFFPSIEPLENPFGTLGRFGKSHFVKGALILWNKDIDMYFRNEDARQNTGWWKNSCTQIWHKERDKRPNYC